MATLQYSILSVKASCLAVVLTAIGLLGACSYQGSYEAIQVGLQNECRELPPSQVDDCLAANSQRYEDYERERREEK